MNTNGKLDRIERAFAPYTSSSDSDLFNADEWSYWDVLIAELNLMVARQIGCDTSHEERIVTTDRYEWQRHGGQRHERVGVTFAQLMQHAEGRALLKEQLPLVQFYKQVGWERSPTFFDDVLERIWNERGNRHAISH